MDTNETLLKEALALHSAGKIQQAKDIYTQILASDPHNADAHYLLGTVYHQTGDNITAESMILKAVEMHPERLGYRINLGVVYEASGKLQEAEKTYSEALLLHPDDPLVLFNLANCYTAQKKFEDAVPCYKKVVAINPDHPAAFGSMGYCYLALDQLENAIDALLKARKLDPANIDHQYNLGICYQRTGDLDNGLVLFNNLTSLAPNNHLVHYQAGYCLFKKNQFEKAEQAFRKALLLHPAFDLTHLQLGNVFMHTERFEDAVNSIKEAIRINNANVFAWSNLGELYELMNKEDEAEDCVDKALAIAPDFPAALKTKGKLLRRKGKYDEALVQLNKISIPEDDILLAARIHLELGKLYDLIGDIDKAMLHFTKMNNLNVQFAQDHDGTAEKKHFLEFVRNTKQKFNQNLLNTDTEKNRVQNAEEDMIFLVGFPRSGTTLLEQILDSHPQLQVMDEKPVLAAILSTHEKLLTNYPESLALLTDNDLKELRASYFDHVDKYISRSPQCKLIDKMPNNLVHVGLIRKIFPRAKFILAIRHPYDVCLSNFMQFFRLNNAMATSLSLNDAAMAYHEVMSLWIHYEQTIHPDFHLVRYEDLVDDTEKEAGALLAFLSVEWDERVLKFYDHARRKTRISTPSYEQVTQPVYKRAKYRWKAYEKYFTDLEHLLAPYVDYFGYDR
jgi:tetratricopeptide (TPR) repeat protein